MGNNLNVASKSSTASHILVYSQQNSTLNQKLTIFLSLGLIMKYHTTETVGGLHLGSLTQYLTESGVELFAVVPWPWLRHRSSLPCSCE